MRVLFLTFAVMTVRFGERECPVSQKLVSQKDQLTLPCILVTVLQRNRTNCICVCVYRVRVRLID